MEERERFVEALYRTYAPRLRRFCQQFVGYRSEYDDAVEECIQEVSTMEYFRGNSHIVSVEDFKVVEYLDEIGGREALLTIPPTKAAYVYALVDDDAFVYTATYDDDTHKQTALDAMTVMVQTTELKETQTQV